MNLTERIDSVGRGRRRSVSLPYAVLPLPDYEFRDKANQNLIETDRPAPR
jgi:hypothetical protein